MKRRGKRALIGAVAVLATAALAAVPMRAMAQDLPQTDLSLTLMDLKKSGTTATVTVRVFNNGPDDLAFGDYRIVFDWPQGLTLRSGCRALNEFACEIDGVAVDFGEGPPFPGPRFLDYSIQLTGRVRDAGVLVSVDDVNYVDVDPSNDGPLAQVVTLP